MDNRFVEKYIKTVERDVKEVENAIHKGAYLSFEEWFDFIFKAEVASYKSTSIAKYATVYPKESGLAQLCADIMAAILSVRMTGFNDSGARGMLKYIVKKLNKLLPLSKRVSFLCDDSDGARYYVLECNDMSHSVRVQIDSRETLCNFLFEVWSTAVWRVGMVNIETQDFMVNKLDNEVSLVMLGKKPAPYVGGLPCNTLGYVLAEKGRVSQGNNLKPLECH